MNRPSTGTALAVSGIVVAVAAVLIPLGSTELAGQKHPDIWSNAWITGGIAVVGLGVVLAVLFLLADIFGWWSEDAARQVPARGASAVVPEQTENAQALPDDGPAWQTPCSLVEPEVPPEEAGESEAAPGPAFTDRWKHTADGFRASPLMHMVSTAMPGCTGMPGQSPFVRIGVCVAADPLPPDASSGQMGARFLEFLSRDPVAGLISALTHVDDGISWTRLAGNGTLLLEATLGTDQDARSRASAMFLSPVIGMSNYGRADGIACLWLHIEPRGQDGSAARPGGLADWYEHLCRAISLAPALAGFLSGDLGLTTRNDPAARVGMLLQTPGGPMTELVDPGELRTLPGAPASTQFIGYGIADPAGKSAGDVARDLLRQLCDHTLYLADFELVLVAIGLGAAAAPAAGGHRPMPSEGAPLVVETGTPEWHNWKQVAYIVALRVTVTNTTDAAIEIARIGLGSDWDEDPPGDILTLGAADQDAIGQEMRAMRKHRYTPELRSHSGIRPGAVITGWVVTVVARSAAGGTPRLTLRIRDSVGNDYVVVRERKEPQTFRSG